MAGSLVVLARQSPLNGGTTVPGAQCFVYDATLTTKRSVYTTSALSVEHTNPVIADANGRLPAIWVDPEGGAYKVVIAPAGDADPPTSPFWTDDNLPVSGISAPVFAQTAAEQSLDIEPTDGTYPECNVKRYGALGNDIADDTAAIQRAFDVAVAAVKAEVVFPHGIYRHTALTIAPSSGQVHINLRGEGGVGGNGVTLRYMGAGGTALSIFDNTRYTVSNLRITDGGTGATGLALRSTSSGSNHGNAVFENVHVSLFTTGVHVGSAGDLAASELTFINLEAHTNGVGVLIEGINSISIRFLNFMGVANSTAALRWSGANDRNGQTINVHGTSFSDNAIDFDLQSACHLTVDGLYTEGTTAGAKVINTAASNDAAVPPMYVSIRNLEDFRSGSAKNTLAWAGTYIFENCAMRVGTDVGDVQANNRYYVRYEGGVYVAPTYAASGQSVVYVSARGGGTNPDNSQGIADFEEFVFLNGGTKRVLASYVWSGHPTSAIPTALPRFDNGLRVGGPLFSDGTPQTLTGAGAVNLTTACTLLVTTGADALTLADGTEGQHKRIVMKTDGGDGTLTPTNLYNGTTLTFNDVGDSADLYFTDGQWVFMGGTATLA